jgi:hypothetical protein
MKIATHRLTPSRNGHRDGENIEHRDDHRFGFMFAFHFTAYYYLKVCTTDGILPW